MKIEFSFPFEEQDLQTALAAADMGNAAPLRSLCRKEVQCFEDAIRQHPDYKDGLVLIERRVVEGYLYQKLRKHLEPNSGIPKEK